MLLNSCSARSAAAASWKRVLIRPAELDVRDEGHRVVRLKERVEKLVLVDRLVLREAQAEVVSLEHARDGDLRHELDELGRAELVEPLGVGADLGDLLVEDL